jgi:hypothetical protein
MKLSEPPEKGRGVSPTYPPTYAEVEAQPLPAPLDIENEQDARPVQSVATPIVWPEALAVSEGAVKKMERRSSGASFRRRFLLDKVAQAFFKALIIST